MPLFGVTIRNFQSSVITETQYPVRSKAAACFGLCGGPPPLPPRCANKIPGNRKRRSAAKTLVHLFAFTRPPRKSVDGPFQRHHQTSVLACNSRRTRDNDDFIADTQRFVRNAGGAQRRGSTPFDGPALYLPVRIGSLHLDERVRIAKHK